jgi:hypothetical protein
VISIRSRHSRRALAIQRSAIAFARGDRTGALTTRVPLPEKTSSNAAVNLLSRSRIKTGSCRPLAKIRQQITGLLGGPRPGRMSRHAQDMHRPGLDFHHEQHGHALQQHGVHVQEVTGQDAG